MVEQYFTKSSTTSLSVNSFVHFTIITLYFITDHDETFGFLTIAYSTQLSKHVDKDTKR